MNAVKMQKASFARLNIERILIDEVIKSVPEMKTPHKITNSIIRKLEIPRIEKFKKRYVDNEKVKRMAR